MAGAPAVPRPADPAAAAGAAARAFRRISMAAAGAAAAGETACLQYSIRTTHTTFLLQARTCLL